MFIHNLKLYFCYSELDLKNLAVITSLLQRLNIKELKPMQEAAIKAIRKGKQVILLSPTGSGKTLAFLLPLVKMLDYDNPGVQALVLTPSRELALQIEQVFKAMQTGFKVNTCYGGHPMATELHNLSTPPALLIGTPGRIADHLHRQSIQTDSIQTLILDEFDKSLELGFKDEMEYIINSINSINTRILTSATTLDEIPAFVGMNDPVKVDFTTTENNAQLAVRSVRAEGSDKLELLFKMICQLGDTTSLIFCNHREAVNRISELLSDKGISHGIFHGGMEQEQREVSLIKFRNGTHHVLLTTDLASRGLDIPEIRNVIHYQLPTTLTAWTHRNGRTARMDEHGTAWLLLAETDYVPEFITDKVVEVTIAEDAVLPDSTPYETIYISAGRKDKISKGDVAGFLMQKGQLVKDDIGKIEILDYASFAAVNRSKVDRLILQIKGEQIKKKTVKVEIAY